MSREQQHMNRSLTDVLAALREDTDEQSRWVKPDLPRQAFIGGLGWVRSDGSYVRGGSVIQPLDLRPAWIDRWRLRRAIRAWAKRRHCHLEGHDAAQYQRKGTRRSDNWAYVAERVTQTRAQCTRCGAGLTEWQDVEDSVRGRTSYSAPAALHDRVMYEGGDWSEPRRVEALS